MSPDHGMDNPGVALTIVFVGFESNHCSCAEERSAIGGESLHMRLNINMRAFVVPAIVFHMVLGVGACSTMKGMGKGISESANCPGYAILLCAPFGAAVGAVGGTIEGLSGDHVGPNPLLREVAAGRINGRAGLVGAGELSVWEASKRTDNMDHWAHATLRVRVDEGWSVYLLATINCASGLISLEPEQEHLQDGTKTTIDTRDGAHVRDTAVWAKTVDLICSGTKAEINY